MTLRVLMAVLGPILASCVPPAAIPPPVAPAAPQARVIPLTASTRPAREAFVLSGPMSQGGLVTGEAPDGTIALTLEGKPVPIEDGRFLIAFDRDQSDSASLVATLRDGRIVRRDLAIEPRQWRIERVDAPLRPSGSGAEYRRIRQGELARINAARGQDHFSGGWRQSFVWPARGRISGLFGSQRIYRGTPGAFHSGVDVAPGAGAPVIAPADGIVVLAGPPAFSLEGNLVIVDHGMGLNSAFLHLATVSVREGQAVRQGDPIGTVGASGRATGPHLHWSLKWRDARLDPLLVAGPMPGR